MFYQREKYSLKGFRQKCDEFDKKFNCSGSAEFTGFSETETGEKTCVISFIVEKEEKFKCVVCLPDEEGPEEFLGDLEAVFVFDQEHMWVERHFAASNTWFVLDSRRHGPEQIKKHGGRDINLGRIFVFRVAKEDQKSKIKPEKKKESTKKEKKQIISKPKRQGDPEEITLE